MAEPNYLPYKQFPNQRRFRIRHFIPDGAAGGFHTKEFGVSDLRRLTEVNLTNANEKGPVPMRSAAPPIGLSEKAHAVPLLLDTRAELFNKVEGDIPCALAWELRGGKLEGRQFPFMSSEQLSRETFDPVFSLRAEAPVYDFYASTVVEKDWVAPSGAQTGLLDVFLKVSLLNLETNGFASSWSSSNFIVSQLDMNVSRNRSTEPLNNFDPPAPSGGFDNGAVNLITGMDSEWVNSITCTVNVAGEVSFPEVTNAVIYVGNFDLSAVLFNEETEESGLKPGDNLDLKLQVANVCRTEQSVNHTLLLYHLDLKMVDEPLDPEAGIIL